jgi:hypothetical protein
MHNPSDHNVQYSPLFDIRPRHYSVTVPAACPCCQVQFCLVSDVSLDKLFILRSYP